METPVTEEAVQGSRYPYSAEAAFRRASGLCRDCGMAWKARNSKVCENCEEQAQIRAMEAQWRAWGIAA
jgi:predicted amidophosphoribosyltransferase